MMMMMMMMMIIMMIIIIGTAFDYILFGVFSDVDSFFAYPLAQNSFSLTGMVLH